MDLSRFLEAGAKSSIAKYDRRGFPIRKDVFESKFVKSDGCWEWAGATNSSGYGSYGMRLAHRVAFELYKSQIPDGASVCHTCDNRKCVNPDHLWLGSRKDNMRDCIQKGRFSNPPRFVGSGHPEAKLTEEKVRQIRAAVQAGSKKRPLARFYGIDRGTLRSILEYRTWRHV